jgi:aryl-alcohol dehydrogenase-like predicted oxidoreductase
LTKRAIDPQEVTVGSKWGYTYTAKWRVEAEHHEVKEHSLPVLQRQWRESLSLLKDHLDLYQIHSATVESGVLDNHEVLAELARLKSEGMCLGLSLSGLQQAEALRKAMSVMFDGARLFDSVQATWNLLEPSTAPALEEAHAAGMGIIIKEALANGRLTDRNDDQSFANRRAILQREATRLSTSLDGLALSSALAQPWADVVLSGAVTVDQLHSNLAALGVAWDEEAGSSLAALAESPETYWKTRSELAWN